MHPLFKLKWAMIKGKKMLWGPQTGQEKRKAVSDHENLHWGCKEENTPKYAKRAGEELIFQINNC